MIFFLEGASQTGKSFLTDELIKKIPNAIRFKGAGAVNVGFKEKWQDYNFYMHNIIERLDQLNNYKVPILWDRGITDAVYASDPVYRTEILRVAKSHIKKSVIYLTTSSLNEYNNLCKLRNSKEGSDIEDHFKLYKNVISSFNTHELFLSHDNNFQITNEMQKQVINFIKTSMNE